MKDLPWPVYKNFFTFMKLKDSSNMTVKCLLCVCPEKILSTPTTSTRNLRKHFGNFHASRLKELDEEMKNSKKRRKTDEERTLDQPSVASWFSPQQDMNRSTVSYKTLEKMVLNFVVATAQPFTVVENESFRTLINGIYPGQKFTMSVETLASRMDDAFGAMKKSIMDELSQTSSVCVTADAWKSYGRSFIGITCHWFLDKNLERRSAAIACHRVKGSLTYDVIANLLREIFVDYKIQNKVCCVVTDNGSNFLKAFREYSSLKFDVPVEEDIEDDDDEVEYVSAGDLLHENDMNGDLSLPPHSRCSCHLLNLVGTKDVSKAVESTPNFKRASRLAIAKLTSLWSTLRRGNHQEYVREKLGKTLPTPNVTRWNSMYDAIKAVVREGRKQPQQLNAVFDHLGLVRLTVGDMEFVNEYCEVMGPLATALDILQGEKNVVSGYLLPSLYRTLSLMKDLENSRHLKFCKPLARAVYSSIQTRFSHVLWDESAVLAACLHPKFRYTWLPLVGDTEKINEAKDWLARAFQEEMPVSTPHTPMSANCTCSDDAETNFFSFSAQDISMASRDIRDEFSEFISSEDQSLTVFENLPVAKRLFIKYNTGLPASAAVERLFSHAKSVLRAERSRLGDKNFEKQLLIKVNVSFLNDK